MRSSFHLSFFHSYVGAALIAIGCIEVRVLALPLIASLVV
jgi:hypothetical protein